MTKDELAATADALAVSRDAVNHALEQHNAAAVAQGPNPPRIHCRKYSRRLLSCEPKALTYGDKGLANQLAL